MNNSSNRINISTTADNLYRVLRNNDNVADMMGVVCAALYLAWRRDFQDMALIEFCDQIKNTVRWMDTGTEKDAT